MGCLDKTAYILVSLIYIIGLTVLGGATLKYAYNIFQDTLSTLGADGTSLYDQNDWPWGIPFGIIAALIQYFRIVWSKERRSSSSKEDIVAHPFLWTTNLHFSFVILFIMIIVLATFLFGIKLVIIKLVKLIGF